jgi:N-acetylglucosaminyldiphosphoundecaprenol N-acetyl-beta-D-mannosaminyltransferase
MVGQAMNEVESLAPQAHEQGALEAEPASRTVVTFPAAPLPRRRVRIGQVDIDAVALDEALVVVEELVQGQRGGMIFTPNVDHIVQVSEDPRLRAAYAEADLSLVDGVPVMWAARALGSPLPEKISGSDFVRPLVARAAERGWGIYFLGGRPGVAAKAQEVLEREFPKVRIVGVSSPDIDLTKSVSEQSDILEPVRAARPHLLFLALGAPKQEIFAQRIRELVNPAVILGVGASLDFVAGEAKRSPQWVSAIGLEWLHRLAQEPRRLWRRYLLRDPKFLAIVLRQAFARGR